MKFDKNEIKEINGKMYYIHQLEFGLCVCKKVGD